MLKNRGSTELQKLLSIEFHTQLLSQESQILFPAFLLAECQFSDDLHKFFLILSMKLSFLKFLFSFILSFNCLSFPFSSLSRQLISLRSWNCFIRKLTMNSKRWTRTRVPTSASLWFCDYYSRCSPPTQDATQRLLLTWVTSGRARWQFWTQAKSRCDVQVWDP